MIIEDILPRGHSKIYCLLLILFLTIPVHATSLEGISFSDTTAVGKENLVLNGLGVRTATLFKVRVYTAGLYLKTKSISSEEILTSKTPKQVRMIFMRDLEDKVVREGWEDSFKRGCEDQCESLKPSLSKLNSLMVNVKAGTAMVYTFVDDKVSISIDGQEKGTIKGPEFSKFLLSSWIGKYPPTEDLKEGLLGKRKME